jgi:hypothetical protein
MVFYTSEIKLQQTFIIYCLLSYSYCFICQYLTMFLRDDFCRSKVFSEDQYSQSKEKKQMFFFNCLSLDTLVTCSIYTFMYRNKSLIFRHLFRPIKSKSAMVKNDEDINYIIYLFFNLYHYTSKADCSSIEIYVFSFRRYWNFLVTHARVNFK